MVWAVLFVALLGIGFLWLIQELGFLGFLWVVFIVVLATVANKYFQ